MFSAFLKTKLLLLLVFVAVVATFYYFGDPQKLLASVLPKLKSTPLAPVVEKLETLNTQELSQEFQSNVQNTEAEISGLTQRASEVGKHAGNVLGSSVTTAPEEKTTPLHERAFEYGKYIYCKQVITDYEAENPSAEKE